MSPSYPFKCPRCGAQVEQVRSMDAEADSPICGDCCVNMERVWSAPHAIFKGTGWGGKK